MRIKHILCKIFGHNWYLFKRDVVQLEQGKFIRMCHRCHDIQEYKFYPIFNWGWASLVGYTKKAGNKKITDLQTRSKS